MTSDKGPLSARDEIEPGVRQLLAGRSAEAQALHSIAISLKRIADALSEPDAYGLTGGAALANAILLGLRDGR